ncbi:hypothetical protein TARUN_5284 [Trichoderma arundinaceum]|uniref:Uncharacterized protein n=1 Tax=Trichoderma arundinaceum TaxID=490622 RepID=A0A395NLW2_TRIAR|nr:hypothetical protein TARUN_5284 [Trichoderma arundinaceum]
MSPLAAISPPFGPWPLPPSPPLSTRGISAARRCTSAAGTVPNTCAVPGAHPELLLVQLRVPARLFASGRLLCDAGGPAQVAVTRRGPLWLHRQKVECCLIASLSVCGAGAELCQPASPRGHVAAQYSVRLEVTGTCARAQRDPDALRPLQLPALRLLAGSPTPVSLASGASLPTTQSSSLLSFFFTHLLFINHLPSPSPPAEDRIASHRLLLLPSVL